MTGDKELRDTMIMMTSLDYKERFKAEYLQLKIRYEKLKDMLNNWDNLCFTPKCSFELLDLQLETMGAYLAILKQRAEIEGIDIV